MREASGVPETKVTFVITFEPCCVLPVNLAAHPFATGRMFVIPAKLGADAGVEIVAAADETGLMIKLPLVADAAARRNLAPMVSLRMRGGREIVTSISYSVQAAICAVAALAAAVAVTADGQETAVEPFVKLASCTDPVENVT